MELQLGVKARDTITGFVGIITGKAEYLTGCVQYVLSPPVDENGKIQGCEWFDDKRLQYVDSGILTATAATGGPQRDAPR